MNKVSLIKWLAADTLIYGLASALSKAAGLFIFPVLTYNFSPEEFGKYDLAIVFASLCANFITFGQDTALSRLYFEFDDDNDRSLIVGQSVTNHIINALILLPIFYIIFQIDFNSKLITEYWKSNLAFFFILLISQVLLNFSLTLMKFQFRRYTYVFVSLGLVATYALFVFLYSEYSDEKSIDHIIDGYVYVTILFATIGIGLSKNYVALSFEFGRFREFYRLAAPIGAVGLLSAGIPVIERQIVLYQLGDETLGVFAAGLKVILLLNIIFNSFHTAWGPFALANYKKSDSDEIYTVTFTLMFCFLSLVLLVFLLLGPTLLELTTPSEYHEAKSIIIPLALSIFIQFFTYYFETSIIIAKKNIQVLYSYFIQLIIFLLIISLMKEYLNITLLCFIILISYCARFITIFYLTFLLKNFLIDFSLIKYLLLLMLASATCIIFVSISFGFGNLYMITILISSLAITITYALTIHKKIFKT